MATLKRLGPSSGPGGGKAATQEGMYARWEVSAPLTDTQSDLVMELAAMLTERPLPKLPAEDNLDDHPHFHGGLDRADSIVADRHDSVVELLGNMEVFAQDLHRIENSHQFFSWFADVESEMDREQEASYRRHLRVMQSYVRTCDGMIADVDQALACLDALTEQHEFVSSKTESLRTACEQLLADQTRLTQYADSIGARLQHFVELERLTLKLNSPNISVLSASFVPILRALDSSIAYVSAHKDFKDSELYLSKFLQLHNKALVLIKLNTVEALRGATAEAKEALAKGTDTFTANYAKFGTKAPPIKALMDELENWSTKYKEYAAVLADCQACYFAQRQELTAPIIYAKMAELNKNHSGDLATWLRSGSGFLQRVCQSEAQLYKRFFPTFSEGLHDLVEALSDILHDHVRPVAIKLTDIHVLAELCDIISTEILIDAASNATGSGSAFAGVMQQIMEDVQGRLVYRMQEYIRKDIGQYVPTDEDLDYPGKLIRAGSRPPSRQQSYSAEGEATIASQPSAAADVYSTWYVPMHRTLMSLSLLYRCIEKSVFEGIAHEAVGVCKAALENASRLIAEKHSRQDGQLFLIKHLLTFREQIAPFDADFVSKNIALDFGTTKAAAYGLLSSSTRLFALGQRNAVLGFLLDGAPAVREQRVDSKKDLDMRLKAACEMFIRDTATALLGPVPAFMEKVTAFALASASGDKGTLAQQPWATPEKVKELAEETLTNIQAKHESILKAMRIYLRNKETEFILFKPIKKNVLKQYRELHKIITDSYSEDDQLIIGLTPVESISLMLTMPG